MFEVKEFDATEATGVTQSVRVVEKDGEPWFVAVDVCKALELVKPNTATRMLGSDEKQWVAKSEISNVQPMYISIPNRGLTVVSESGLYKLIMRSDKPQARPFQDWVTKVVLPAIRKDGAYIQGEEKVATGEMSEDELVLQAVGILQKKVDRLKAEKQAVEGERDQLQHELDHMTIGEYCVEIGEYLTQSMKGRLSHRCRKIANREGITLEKVAMKLERNGKIIDTAANVYPRHVLDSAMEELVA